MVTTTIVTTGVTIAQSHSSLYGATKPHPGTVQESMVLRMMETL